MHQNRGREFNSDGLCDAADLLHALLNPLGTIEIDAEPDGGSWTLTGPESFDPIAGTGDRTGASSIACVPPGVYTLVCSDNLPSHNPPPEQVGEVPGAGLLHFIAGWTPDPTPSITPSPSPTPTPTSSPTPLPNEITILLPDNVPLVLVRIPAGSFQMGSPEEELGHIYDEDLHTVTITQEFYIGRYEITQRQWMALMRAWPVEPPTAIGGIGDNKPVYFVTWQDAVNFTTALNTHIVNTGQGPLTTSLPTEAEWEYATRGGTQTRFFFGDGIHPDGDELCGVTPDRVNHMWYCGNDDPDGAKDVGSLQPNPFGLHDTLGNVWEWCRDWYDSKYFENGPAINPQGPATGSYRVIRGGYSESFVSFMRCASRSYTDPTQRRISFGLRIVAR